MKAATVTATPTGESSGFSWVWRCEADNVVRAGAFAFYYDCVADAQKHGYTVEVARAHGATAPGGVAFNLRSKGE
jgi:hypothetical protein